MGDPYSKRQPWRHVPFASTHPEVLHYQVQYVDQLRYGVAFLHDDFARPVGEHLVAVLHAGWHGWSEDGHRLADDGTGFHGVGLQKAVEDLKKPHIFIPLTYAQLSSLS